MRNNKGFVVSAVLYPLLVIFLALIMGLLAMSTTRKKILENMKNEVSDTIFDTSSCDCEEIGKKLKELGEEIPEMEEKTNELRKEMEALKKGAGVTT